MFKFVSKVWQYIYLQSRKFTNLQFYRNYGTNIMSIIFTEYKMAAVLTFYSAVSTLRFKLFQ